MTDTILTPLDLDIENARESLERAEYSANEVRFGNGGGYSDDRDRARALASARETVTFCRERLESLERMLADREAARAARPAAEQAAAPLIGDAQTKTKATAAGVVTALAEAQKALVALDESLRVHNAAVREHSGKLRAAGLDLPAGEDYRTGATPAALLLAGRWVTMFDRHAIPGALLHRVAVARLGPLSGLTQRVAHMPGLTMLSGLFGTLPAVPVADDRSRWTGPVRPDITTLIDTKLPQPEESDRYGYSHPLKA